MQVGTEVTVNAPSSFFHDSKGTIVKVNSGPNKLFDFDVKLENGVVYGFDRKELESNVDIFAEIQNLVALADDQDYLRARGDIIDRIGEKAYLILAREARRLRQTEALARMTRYQDTTSFL